MADRTGFLAMAIDEIVVHGRDVAAALSIPFDPPQTIAGKVVDRLFPWTPPHDDNWAALLWANGRLTVPGWPVVPADWGWWPAPLHEWDGTGPLEYRGNASYRLDPTSQRWLPNDT